MFKKDSPKPKILFIDEKNDLTSQIAEYYARKTYGDKYDIYSAGPEHDMVDCDMISVMYQAGEDLRRQISKDFKDTDFLPEDGMFDTVIYLRKSVFEEWASRTPWKGNQILVEMGSTSDFKATDDAELGKCYEEMIDRVRRWVEENLSDYEKLRSLVSA